MTSLPITCVHTIVIASHWVGFTFPGMMDDPGSLAGIKISPMPERGPLANQRISLAILNNDPETVFNALDNSTMLSCPPNASNLFSAVLNGRPVKLEISFATCSPNPSNELIPVPTAVPPMASS